MANITLSIDEGLVLKARKVALERKTTLSQMVRDYLETIAQRDQASKQRAIRSLRRSFSANAITIGKRSWTRDDLHER